MDQIKQDQESGLYIIHLDLNMTQKSQWQSKVWSQVARPEIELGIPGGCYLSWTSQLPEKKSMLFMQHRGFAQGQISMGTWHELDNSNFGLLTNFFNLDEDWLQDYWNLFPPHDSSPPPGFEDLIARVSVKTNHLETNHSIHNWLPGVEGLFEIKDFNLLTKEFLNSDHISFNTFTKPMLRVSYVRWEPGKEQSLPGRIDWVTGLTLPLHLKK